jgi:hypothetical protein
MVETARVKRGIGLIRRSLRYSVSFGKKEGKSKNESTVRPMARVRVSYWLQQLDVLKLKLEREAIGNTRILYAHNEIV